MSPSSEIRVAVVGTGSWGATGAALASVNTPATLWAPKDELVAIDATRVEPACPPTFTGTGDLIATCASKDVAVEQERTELRPS